MFLFLKFLRLFCLNLFTYRNKRVPVGKFQIWVGKKCTLKCKNCSQLFPYFNGELYDLDDVIRNLQKVLPLCEVDSFHIVGGEPFFNKDIYKLIDFVCKQKHKSKNKVISNGTIIPSAVVLDVLRKYAKQIFVTVSLYECAAENQARFKDACFANDIDCQEVTPVWHYVGDPGMKEITDLEAIKKNYQHCWDKSCKTFAKDTLSVCPRMQNSSLFFSHRAFFIENLHVKYIPQNFIGRALVATCFDESFHRNACRYCHGVSAASGVRVFVAEQLQSLDS